MSENRVEWAIADFAALSAGAITVPIYPTLSAPQVHTLLGDSRPVVIFVSTAALLQKLQIGNSQLGVRYVVTMDPEIHEPAVLRLEALYEMGRQGIYDYPGEYRESGEGEHYVRVRIDELHSEFERAEAACNVREIAVGRLFTLSNAPRRDQEVEYLITEADYELRDNSYETSSTELGAAYTCAFSALTRPEP